MMPFAEVVGPLGGGVFLKGAHHWGWASGVHSLPGLPVRSLYFLHVTRDVSSQLPSLITYSHASPAIMDLASGTIVKIKSSLFSCSILSQESN